MPRALPDEQAELDFPPDYAFVILGSAAAISDGLVAALSMAEYPVIHLKPGTRTRRLGEQEFEIDFSSEKTSSALTALLDDSIKPGALINLLNLDPGSEPETGIAASRMLFLTLKLFSDAFQSSIENGAGWLFNFTRLDGQFGLAHNQATRDMFPEQAASTGIAKSVGREWPGLRVKCIDLEPDVDPHVLLAQVLEELDTTDPAIEVGMTARGRIELALQPASLTGHKHLDQDLNQDSVMLISGGAYGITARFARFIARRFKSTLVILGRSPWPGQEQPETLSCNDPAQLRQHLIDTARRENATLKPAEIERELRTILKNREIRDNFAQIEALGSRLVYHSVDLSDAKAFRSVIEDTYAQFGRLDAVIHGAGIIDDRLLQDKSLASFDRVMNTKTAAVRVMLDSLRPQGLKFVLFFSSVAARFGNVGQCDYSAANEVLNKTASLMQAMWPDTRALSINWGPWNAGMVSESLGKLYASKGLNLIPPDLGLAMGMRELFDYDDSEVLIAADTDKISQWGLG